MPANQPVTPGQLFLTAASFRLGERLDRIRHCVGQLTGEQVWWRPADSANSIGNILLHLCGNVRQWITCGVTGAPDTRDRPREFSERDPLPGAELLARLSDVVREAQEVLARVSDGQLTEPRRIQGFEETVLSAVFHSVEHFSGHTQEVVYITRLQLGDRYRFAWQPQTPEEGA